MANLLFLAAKTAGRLSNNFTGRVCGGRERAGDTKRSAAPCRHPQGISWSWGAWGRSPTPHRHGLAAPSVPWAGVAEGKESVLSGGNGGDGLAKASPAVRTGPSWLHGFFSQMRWFGDVCYRGRVFATHVWEPRCCIEYQ